ncbi:hypothetical protein M9Y10_008955 [Tritrichomonas musculus]|uniref:Uncharacterized protein n=1 Tax=Tritrichomonas musculus TaxID=1915356 RepID=A0ABR2J1E3_9EUKA
MSIICNKGLSFKLNEQNFTAIIINLVSPEKSIFIPRSIQYLSHDYIIRRINDKAFKDNKTFQEICKFLILNLFHWGMKLFLIRQLKKSQSHIKFVKLEKIFSAFVKI